MASATTSDYLYNKQLGQLFKAVAFTTPANLYIALFTSSPSLNGTGGAEVSTSGTGYARVSVPPGTEWSGPDGSLQYSNTNDITFGAPTANWGTIVSAGIYDAATGGNLLYVAPLAVAKTVSSGDGNPRVLAGQMKISRATCA